MGYTCTCSVMAPSRRFPAFPSLGRQQEQASDISQLFISIKLKLCDLFHIKHEHAYTILVNCTGFQHMVVVVGQTLALTVRGGGGNFKIIWLWEYLINLLHSLHIYDGSKVILRYMNGIVRCGENGKRSKL